MSIRKVVSKLISLFASHIPTNNSIVFASYPDYSDNSYAIYKYALRKKLNIKWELIWIISQKNRLEELKQKLKNDGDNVRVVYKYTLEGVWTYIRSRFAFETHSLFPYIMLRQHTNKHICLWHGMPLKKIGASIPGHEEDSPNCDFLIAVSTITQKCISEAFRKPLDRVLIVGQPRNDLLFEESDYLEEIKFNHSKYKSVGIWLPTYRKAIVGDIRTDGEYKEGKISFLSIEDLASLNIFLKEKNYFLFIKLHPMDALQLFNFDQFSNIKVIKPNEFHYQLYPLLGQCDYLLTDYSSVFVDYDILQKPMAFVMDDIDSYLNSRGLYFNNLSKILPGPIITNYDNLLEFIENPTYLPSDIEWNKYKDNNASHRILDFLELI